MRLRVTKSKNVNLYYVIKTVYVNGKEKTITVEKLGNDNDILKKSNGLDPTTWAKKYIAELNKKEKDDNVDIIIKKSTSKLIPKNVQTSFNGGYLFLEQIYYALGLDKICKDISKKYKFHYDLDSILSRLIYGRIIFPASKLATNDLARKFIEQPNFELQHIYRALEIISKESDFIQSKLYLNSLNLSKRNTSILYYDCTNYFFESEHENGLRQYGPSKEHRPNPIVQMGLFMDGDGIPLAFNISSGNTNEQTTLSPLEEKILKDFNLSKFIVCTDAGLASIANRKFNDKNDRKIYNISKLEDTEDSKIFFKDKIFYKERWINENGLEQKLIVTFSLKYKNYQRQIRNSQIERAKKSIESNNISLDKYKQTDFKRLVSFLLLFIDF